MDESSTAFMADLIRRLGCLHGREAGLKLDAGLMVAMVAASVLLFWFLVAHASRRVKQVGSSRAFALMMIAGLCALFPVALLLEGLSDGTIWLPVRRKRIEFLAACDPEKFWSVAALYWFMAMALVAFCVAAWSRWRRPSHFDR